MSLTSSLQIAIGSMLANQGAIAVVTNNIANANTPGYTREVATLVEAPADTVGDLQFGTGVVLQGIQSIRDNILQLRLNQETPTQSQLTTLSQGLNQVQTLFNEPAGTGLQSALSAFFGSFQQLSSDPANLGLRQSVISAGQTLATGFHQSASALITQQQDADQGVTQTVQQINTLTTQIAQLNSQISQTAGEGLNTNTLQDQQNELINQVSQLVEVQTIPANNNSITVTTANGAQLVVGNQSFNLQTQTNAATGFQDVFSQGSDITSAIQSGTLGADIQLRDQQIPSILNNLDTLANGIATAVNTQSAAGFDLNGAAGGNFFVPPAAVAGSALNLSVAITDPSKIAASADGTPGNNANATALANLQNANIVGGQNPLTYYSNLVFQVGNSAATVSGQLTGENLLVQQIQDQIGSVSGVSIDEEGAHLIQYQSAFTAAAQVAGIVNTLFQTTINMVTAT